MILELRQEGEFQFVVKDSQGKAVAGFNCMEDVNQYMEDRTVDGRKWAKSTDPGDLRDRAWMPAMPSVLSRRRPKAVSPEPY